MKSLLLTSMTALLLSSPLAFAQEPAMDPAIEARQEIMREIAANTKILGEMAGEKTAFDANAAAAAKAALVALAAEVGPKFEANVDHPKAESRPEVWSKREEFLVIANNYQTALEGIDTATLAGVQAGMQATGGYCRECHTAFRAKK